MVNLSLQIVNGTDKGRVRKLNEDCVGIDENRGLFVLADGMGGHKAGEVASAMAVEILLEGLATIQDNVKKSELQKERFILDQLKSLIIHCNQEIYTVGQSDDNTQGMGATVVAGMLYEDALFYVHVGDSRLYRYRDEKLHQLTEDHTLLQEVIRQSDALDEFDLEAAIPSNIVTRALGAGPDVDPDCFFTMLDTEDLYLSCSDGLSDRLSDEIIRKTIESSDQLQPLLSKLILLANEAGGEDNISVVLMKVGEEEGLLDRVKRFLG